MAIGGGGTMGTKIKSLKTLMLMNLGGMSFLESERAEQRQIAIRLLRLKFCTVFLSWGHFSARTSVSVSESTNRKNALILTLYLSVWNQFIPVTSEPDVVSPD